MPLLFSRLCCALRRSVERTSDKSSVRRSNALPSQFEVGSNCVSAVLRASVTSICSVEVFPYWVYTVSPTGTFPLGLFFCWSWLGCARVLSLVSTSIKTSVVVGRTVLALVTSWHLHTARRSNKAVVLLLVHQVITKPKHSSTLAQDTVV